MPSADNNSIVEEILIRAAEQAGDITGAVMALFYRQYPGARQSFIQHAAYRTDNLEGDMVQQAIYCLMVWFQSPGEVRILLAESVPHHSDTLGVSPDHYLGLLLATAAIIGDTIPPDNAGERAIWNTLTGDLTDVVNTSRRFIAAKP